MRDTPKVSDATDALLAILEEGRFQYALVGGLAVVLQGYDRNTQDVDALVWDLDAHLDRFIALAKAHGLRPATPTALADARSIRILYLLTVDGTAVDVLLGFLPFEREVVNRAATMTLHDGVTALVSSPEDLIIMKLIASRGRDRYDVIALVELYPDIDKSRVRRVVTEYAELLDRPDILHNLNELVG